MSITISRLIGTHQELLRHANSRMTLEVYTRGISETKREANDLVVQMMLEGGNQRLSAPSGSTVEGSTQTQNQRLRDAI